MSLIKDPRKTLNAIHNRVTVNIPMATIDLDYIVRHLDYKFISEHVDIDTICSRINWNEKIVEVFEQATPEDIEQLIGSKLSLLGLSDVTIPVGRQLKNGDSIYYDEELKEWVVSDKLISPEIYNAHIEASEIKNSIGKHMLFEHCILDGGKFR